MKWTSDQRAELNKWIRDPHFQTHTDRNLRGANLRRANLCGANLRGVNLYGANLYGADLYKADLHGADLYRANLYQADLYKANLREAHLQGANLYGANLREAHLQGANLCGTGLYVFYTTQHQAIYIPWQRRLKIGCEEYDLDHWMEHYQRIGRHYKYSAQEIAQYGKFIQICKEASD